MIPGSRKTRSIPLYVAAGWLFADLLLGIAMVFLIASPGAPPPPLPTPTATVPKPTPTQQPLIETKYQTVMLTGVDVGSLQSGAVSGFQKSVLDKLKSQGLSTQCAGLVITYVGQDGAYSYTDVGNNVNTALHTLGQQGGGGAFFKQSAYHEPLVLEHTPNSTIKLEVYLYTSSIPCFPPQG